MRQEGEEGGVNIQIPESGGVVVSSMIHWHIDSTLCVKYVAVHLNNRGKNTTFCQVKKSCRKSFVHGGSEGKQHTKRRNCLQKQRGEIRDKERK